MAILEDLKWNITHIQNSFIIDPSGTCDTAIHSRDQLTVEEIADRKENDEFYDSSPEIRPLIYEFDNCRNRSNTDKLLKEYTTRKILMRSKEQEEIFINENDGSVRPLSLSEIQKKVERNRVQSEHIRQKIIKEQPIDMRPFADYKKFEVKNPGMLCKKYNVSLYKRCGNKLECLKFCQNGEDEEQKIITVSIKETGTYKDLVGLTCFLYINGQKDPKPELSFDEIGDGTHSIYISENEKIELEWNITLDMKMKDSFFDIESLRNDDQNDFLRISLAIVENCEPDVDEEVVVHIGLVDIPFIQDIPDKERQQMIVTVKKSSLVCDILNLIIRKFHVDQANDGNVYCLKTKYKNDFIKLTPESTLAKEIHDKLIQQGPSGEIIVQLAQDKVPTNEPTPVHPTEPQRSFEVKIYSRRIGSSGVEHTLNFGDEGINISAKGSNKSLMNRLTPIKHKLNKLIYFNDMIEVSDAIDAKGGKSMIVIYYKATSKFEQLNIRADKTIISKILDILLSHKVKLAEESPSHIPRRRRSLFQIN